MIKPASRLLPSLLTVFLLAQPLPALASASADYACAALTEARTGLMLMLDVRDPRLLARMRAQVRHASAFLEGMVNQMSATEPERAAAFRPHWEAFKRTRELAIIPALMLGDHEDARILATGVQAERLAAMKQALGCP
jgi:hypothetical protein